ncbi:tetratricopeptide repeat protein [Pedobacter sp. BS3]|uniref:tetratricopeptide repeat protein n=1 Tax=Pedobacter sp. BS3 TaxID=2567937 RepID=UPI0011EBA37E|nr:tetratricopeptide repeat protein [Pedobacter sp. BS3]TZF82262.1 tetratricopeptide repeat protein [Pedobacter sp. BS3]
MRLLLAILICISIAISASAQYSADDALAAQYYRNGDFEKALTLYQKLYNNNASLYYEPYLNSLLQLKQYAEAEKLTRKLSKTYPDNYTYAIDYGRVLQQKGEQKQAEDWLNGLIRTMPASEEDIRNLATAFYRTENFEYVVKTLLNGRERLHNNDAFAFELVSVYRFTKNKPMLVEEYLNIMSKNQALLPQAEKVMASVFDDNKDYDLLKTALLKRIQKEPQNTAYAELLTWQYLQQQQFDMALKQAIALDKRLNENGERIYDMAGIFMANNKYQEATQALQYVIGKGEGNPNYIPAKVQLLNCQYQLLTTGSTFSAAQLQQLEAGYLELLSKYGRSVSTAFAMKQLAHLQAYHLNKSAEAETLLKELIALPRLPASMLAQAKLDLADIYIRDNSPWEASLLYGQVEKQFPGDPLAQEAKFRNARLSYFMGDFTWAKAQTDVLKGSTSQLIANDALNLSLLIAEHSDNPADSMALKHYAYADLLIYKGRLDEAIASLDSITKEQTGTSLADDILMAKAKIYQQQHNWQQMVNALQEVTSNYSTGIWADDAWFMLGDIYQHQLNDTKKAADCYQKILTDYPGSLLLAEARQRYRLLRGDKVTE